MSQPRPLGERESANLEFKRFDVRSEAVARAVASMLNSAGGEIWIGIEEHDGVATGVQSLSEPELERKRVAIRDAVLTAVEPTPLEREFELLPIALASQRVLQLKVRRGKRGPYAWMQGSARHFDMRIQDRVRAMSREELRRAFEGGSGESERVQARTRLAQRRTKFLEGYEGGLWVGLQPLSGELDLDQLDAKRRTLLEDAAGTGNRDSGWNFVSSYNTLKPAKDRRLFGAPESYTRTEFHRDGAVLFFAPEDRLHWKGPPNALWPFALLEYPIAIFRLVRALPYSEMPSEFECELGILNAQKWTLKAGSPADRWSFDEPHPYPDTEPPDLLIEGVTVTREDLRDKPDAAAMRLVERAYEVYGLSAAQLPPEFDRNAGRLVLPP